ncbi:MAG: protein-glutamate O-methyltransferase CheR [Armatimonadota bacterium]|nr:protein-glutamate O-methyltransferase CheR [Armatimonadota bacterium]MDR7435744.1 protein-glutamate O-methyltransferase CheR [Armatimonadota bacterium]
MAETKPRVEEDFAQLRQFLLSRCGFDLGAYKLEQMRRRLEAAMFRLGVASYAELLRRLREDPKAVQDLIDRLTINVSEFFRNPEKFHQLETVILPRLLRRWPRLRAWSAGCSYGAEPYSLAILLREVTGRSDHQILATDIDQAILERARRGEYTSEEVKNVPIQRLRKYFYQKDNLYVVHKEIKSMVEFRRHDLLRDPFEDGWHLILCRNVVIYFTEAAKTQLYTRFYHALADGGVLFIGATEQILNARAIGFTSPLPFFYEKTPLKER